MSFVLTNATKAWAAGDQRGRSPWRGIHMAAQPWWRRHRAAAVLAVAAALGLVTWLTYVTGGTAWVIPHLYYLPIIAGGFLGGWAGGLLVALLAGLLCGPAMPLNAAEGLAQPMANWLMRLGFFGLVGGFAGVLFTTLSHRIRDLDRLTHETVLAFVKTVDAKSAYTARHSENVAAYAVVIGERLGLNEPHLRRLFWAGLLHDIGKLRIPDAVLNKPGQLTEEEWQLMRDHPVESARMIEGIAQFRPYIPAVRHHHERIDGKGYPDGLTGEQMTLDTRILAVADAFEAMTSDRPYRPGLCEAEAIDRLRQGMGTQFDAVVVEALVQAHAHGQVHVRAVREPVAERANEILSLAG